MKKTMLGLAAMLLVGVATYGATGPAADGTSSIDITTSLNMISGGIIINPDGGENMGDLTLEHGTFLVGNALNSIKNGSVYVKTTGGGFLPAGTKLNIELKATSHNLIENQGQTEIPHTLTLSAIAGGSGDNIVIEDGKLTVSKEFTSDGDANFQLDIKSEISLEANATSSLPQGSYQNVTTMTVSLAK